MADIIVHNRTTDPSPNNKEIPQKPISPAQEKPVPPTGTYVIQIPKDQVYRLPPPENSLRYSQYAPRKPRRNSCCLCLCWLLGLFAIFTILAAISVAVFYLVFLPESPKYSVDNLSIKGINLTSPSTISPKINATIRAHNPNNKIGIYYRKGSSVSISYSGINLCEGVLPTFYQPSNNVTMLKMALTGPEIKLNATDRKALISAQSQGKVHLKLKLRTAVKIKVGAVKTLEITVKVNCDVVVDKLTTNAKIVSKDCDYGVVLW